MLHSHFILGFIGGGQLARMSALQALRFGIQIAVYTSGKTPEPVEFMTPHVFKGRMDDEEKLTEFARFCDVVTLENEFLDGSLLERVLENSKKPIYPSPGSFKLIEDKWTEKQTFQKAGIPVAAHAVVRNAGDLFVFGEKHGWPYILKSAKGGYDGYGNVTVRDPETAQEGFMKLGGHSNHLIIAEKMIPFSKELAVMVARNKTGVVAYPCVETIQEDHICKEVIAPAPVSQATRAQAQELAIAATEAIDGTGVFGFEFFLTYDNALLLNESAPRPHNSGHYSIEGCVTSQFENHVRAVCGLPLGKADLIAPAAVMINILGKNAGSAGLSGANDALYTENAHLHVYGKLESRPGRKMGHLTLLGRDVEKTLAAARSLAGSVRI